MEPTNRKSILESQYIQLTHVLLWYLINLSWSISNLNLRIHETVGVIPRNCVNYSLGWTKTHLR